MKPVLFEWGWFHISSYGVLVALAFIAAVVIGNREFRKNKADLAIAWDIYLLAILGGLAGARLLFIIENWSEFLAKPAETLFSTAGFSVLGGFLLSFILCAVRVRKAGEPFLKMADLCSPSMAIGYAIGRLGCITAGDGCYGLPTQSCVGMTFPNGLVPTLSAKNLLLKNKFLALFPHLPIPIDIPVHPTPLYESLSGWLLGGFLLLPGWKIGPGKRFAAFLAWFGISRFFVEFIRLNPIWHFGLTSDQVLAIGMVFCSIFLFFISSELSQKFFRRQGNN